MVEGQRNAAGRAADMSISASPAQPPFTIRTHPSDNVVIATRSIPSGTAIESGLVTATNFELGQKIASEPIAVGETVRRYGESIGVAIAEITPGQLVHDHNLASTYQSGVTRRTEQTHDHA